MATPSRWSRRLAGLGLSLLVGGVLAGTVGAPSYAQQTDVPDAGPRPEAAGPISLPDGTPARPPAERLDGPLAAEIAEVEIRIETLTHQLGAILPEVGPAVSAAEFAAELWQSAVDDREAAQSTLDELVGVSFRGAAALPAELYLPQLPGLSVHAPMPIDAPLGTQAAARSLLKAQEAERIAAELLAAAEDAEQTLAELQTDLEAELAQLRDDLADLREENAALLAEEERAREVAAQAGAAERFPDLAPVAGFQAHPDAIRAVRFAMSELGKPYLWGAAGPDRYDCSGLVLASYNSVGRQLPRVAADQYQGTQDRLITRSAAVAQQGLLPGDLVFFGASADPRSIHHVGIYVGAGQMVHAPNSNDVVKVSPVWWSRFFGATRVIDAVPVDGSSPSPTPPGTTPPGTTPPGTTPPGTPPGTTPPPTTPPTTTPVPSLIGDTPDEAEAALAQAGLVGNRGDDPITDCDETDRGLVVFQDPVADERVLVGATVRYRICDPPDQDPDPVDMPSLINETRVAAEQALENLGLGLEIEIDEVPSTEPAGRVVSTDPEAGVLLHQGDTVVLRISDGSLVAVPNVVELSCQEAIETLEEHGLEPVIEPAPEPTIGPGHVDGQDPPADTEVPRGSSVTIEVNDPDDDCLADQNGNGENGEGGGAGVNAQSPFQVATLLWHARVLLYA